MVRILDVQRFSNSVGPCLCGRCLYIVIITSVYYYRRVQICSVCEVGTKFPIYVAPVHLYRLSESYSAGFSRFLYTNDDDAAIYERRK